MAEKEKIAKAPQRRARRIPLGRRSVLTVEGKDPNFIYRIVNDTGDRIERFKDADYELVGSDEVRVGDKRLGTPTSEGFAGRVSVGQGQYAYVMRIPREFYEEDQAAKQAEVQRVEDETRREALNGTYGKLEITRD